jgi:hypothetical protein
MDDEFSLGFAPFHSIEQGTILKLKRHAEQSSS